MAELNIQLAKLAIQDLVAIEDYTARTWGQVQADKYLTALEQRFYWLSENAKLGTLRKNIGCDVYSFPEGSHVIFYRVKGSALEIARILHQSMDLDVQFAGE